MIDDHAKYTAGLALAFSVKSGLEVVGQETTAIDGVDVALDLQPDVVLCDYRMPGEANGLDCAATLRSNGFAGEIVILTGYAAPGIHAEAALLEDVRVISKDLPLGDIIETVSAARPTDATAVTSGLNLDEYILEEMVIAESAADSAAPNRKRKIIVATAAAAAAITAGVLLLSGSGEAAATAGVGLEQPFVLIDGTTSDVRVTVEVDGVPTESFTPANLPITVVVGADTSSTDVQVLVENLDASGTASCAIGMSKEVLVSDTALPQTNAVCATTIK